MMCPFTHLYIVNWKKEKKHGKCVTCTEELFREIDKRAFGVAGSICAQLNLAYAFFNRFEIRHKFSVIGDR